MSYHEALLPLKGPGLTLLEGENLDEGGSNGSGKSVPWDAISWCLFGQTVRGLKADEVINRDIGEDCLVRVNLYYKDFLYSILRTRKHGDKKESRLVVQIEGEHVKKKVEKGTVADTQDWLLEEFGIDFELFRCTVIFAQGETFNFINATNKKQKEILSKVMRVDFSVFLEYVRKFLKDKNINKLDFDKKIAILKSHKIEDIDSFYKKEIEEWDAKIEERQLEIKQEIEESKGKLNEIAKEQLDDKNLKKLEDKINIRIDEYRELNKKLHGKHAEARVQRKIENDKLEKLSELKGECSTCFQPVDFEDNQKRMEEVESRRVLLNDLACQFFKKIEDSEKEIDKLLGKRRKVCGAIDKQKQLVIDFERTEKELKKSLVHAEELNKEKNPFEEKKEEALLKQKKIALKLKELSKKIKQINEEMSYYAFWETGFGDAGIKSFIFDLICSTLTERANYYVGILTNNQVMITFDTQTKLKSGEFREKFEAAVIEDGDKIPYHSYSGGEGTKISRSVDMSLSDLMTDYYGSEFNMVVFDEQENYLDVQGRQAYLKLLKEISKKKRVFVVSHDSEFKSHFDDVVVIQKKDGVSRIAA